jgi:hypothetical protein
MFVAAVAALTLGCDSARRAKEVADSVTAAAADSAQVAAAADSVRRSDSLQLATAKADSIARARTAAAKTGAALTTKSGGTAGRIIGRDSVRQGPIIRMPLTPDTIKKRPPR